MPAEAIPDRHSEVAANRTAEAAERTKERELRFPRVAAPSWRRWLARLWPSHRPLSPPRRRVYPSFPPLCVAPEESFC